MTDFVPPMNRTRPQASIVPRPLPPGLPVPALHDPGVCVALPPRPPQGHRTLPAPSKEVCELYNRTANVTITPKPLPPKPRSSPKMTMPVTRHTRQRSGSLRGSHPLQFTVSGGLELVRMKEPHKQFMVMQVDDNQPLLSSTKFNIHLNDSLSSPVITIKLPSTPLSPPPPPSAKGVPATPTVATKNSPPKVTVPKSPTSPPPRPTTPASQAAISAREARSRLLASMMLKKFQGGRSRRSSCLAAGGFTKKPSGLSKVTFPVDDDDDGSESDD